MSSSTEKLVDLRRRLENVRCSTHRMYQEKDNACPKGEKVRAELRSAGDEIPCDTCKSREIVEDLLNFELVKFRYFFLALLKDFSDNTVIWCAASHRYTVAELRAEIEAGSNTGLQYITDVMQVCRDFLKNSAQANSNSPALPPHQ